MKPQALRGLKIAIAAEIPINKAARPIEGIGAVIAEPMLKREEL